MLIEGSYLREMKIIAASTRGYSVIVRTKLPKSVVKALEDQQRKEAAKRKLITDKLTPAEDKVQIDLF